MTGPVDPDVTRAMPGPPPGGSPPLASEPPDDDGKRWRWYAAIALAVGLLVGGGVALVASSGGGDSTATTSTSSSSTSTSTLVTTTTAPPVTSTATTPATPPGQVTGLSAGPGGGSGETSLHWNPVTGAVSYRVYRTSTQGTSGSLVATVNNTAYNDTPGGVSYYQVSAVNGAGLEGPRSLEACGAPVGLTC